MARLQPRVPDGLPERDPGMHAGVEEATGQFPGGSTPSILDDTGGGAPVEAAPGASWLANAHDVDGVEAVPHPSGSFFDRFRRGSNDEPAEVYLDEDEADIDESIGSGAWEVSQTPVASEPVAPGTAEFRDMDPSEGRDERSYMPGLIRDRDMADPGSGEEDALADDDADYGTGVTVYDEAVEPYADPGMPAVAEYDDTVASQVPAVITPSQPAVPSVLTSVRSVVAGAVDRYNERASGRSQANKVLQLERAAQRARELEAAAERQRQAEEAHRNRIATLNIADAQRTDVIIDQMTADRIHASLIEPAELLRLPTIAQANARVRELTAQKLVDVVDSEGGALDASRNFFNPAFLERTQTSALFRETFAKEELARVTSKKPRITELTDANERQARIDEARDTVAGVVRKAQESVLEKVYVNPFPETGEPHREYAFELATQVAGVPEGRADTMEGTRSTVVFARMAVGDNGQYAFVDGMDGISPILQRCGDPRRGEGVFLTNVVPGGLDGRVSGVFVRRPGDTYDGGITIEARYAGKHPIEPEVIVADSGAVDSDAMRRAYLQPEYDAVFEIEARHFESNHYNAVQAGIIARDEIMGRQAFVDPRMLPLFEAQATMVHALTGFDAYADTVEKAHEAGRNMVNQQLQQAGYAYGGVATPPALGRGNQ